MSYDAAVSDDDRAQEVYVRKQLAAGIPVPPTAPPTTSPTGTPTDTATGTPTGAASGAPSATGSPAATAPLAGKAPATGAPSGTATPPATPTPTTTGLEPRVLEGLGDIAYVDDVLGAVGANGHQRAVSVVFRTSNVIVTVSYWEQTTGSVDAPDSAELQEKARNLARQLAERLEE